MREDLIESIINKCPIELFRFNSASMKDAIKKELSDLTDQQLEKILYEINWREELALDDHR